MLFLDPVQYEAMVNGYHLRGHGLGQTTVGTCSLRTNFDSTGVAPHLFYTVIAQKRASMTSSRSRLTVSVNERFQDVLAEEDLFYQVCRTAVDDSSRRLLLLALWDWKVSAAEFFSSNGEALNKKALCAKIQDRLKLYATAKARRVALRIPVRTARFVVDWILYYTSGKRIKARQDPPSTFDLLNEGQCATRIFAANYRNDQLHFVQLLQKECQRRVDAEEGAGVYGTMAAELLALKAASVKTDGSFDVKVARQYLLNANEARLSALTLLRPSGSLRQTFIEISQAIKLYQPGFASRPNVNPAEFGLAPVATVDEAERKRLNTTEHKLRERKLEETPAAEDIRRAQARARTVLQNDDSSLDDLVLQFDPLVRTFRDHTESVLRGPEEFRRELGAALGGMRQAIMTEWRQYLEQQGSVDAMATSAALRERLEETQRYKKLFVRYLLAESVLTNVVDESGQRRALRGYAARSVDFEVLNRYKAQLLTQELQLRKTITSKGTARAQRSRVVQNQVNELQAQLARLRQ